MIDQLSKHSLFDIKIQAKGDLHIDYHHTTEDTALALGDAFNKSISDKKGSIDLVRHSLRWMKQF